MKKSRVERYKDVQIKVSNVKDAKDTIPFELNDCVYEITEPDKKLVETLQQEFKNYVAAETKKINRESKK